MGIEVSTKNIYGRAGNMNLFEFFNDGIRKRLPKYVASEFREELKQNILINRYGFQLSKKWVEHKKRIGADDRPFIMFRHYIDNIEIMRGDDGRLAVGFKKRLIHPRANTYISDLALHLEYGDLSRGIPARPLWRNTGDSFFSRRKLISRKKLIELLEGKR